jgi:acetyl-CoA synthetase
MDEIRKSFADWTVTPHLTDYRRACADFSWSAELAAVARPDGGVNIAHCCIGAQLDAGRGERVALRFLAAGAPSRDLTYRELAMLAARFANVLTTLGMRQGERVASLLGRVPELYATALGTWSAGAVFNPLFSAFGPEPVKARLQIGGARVLVTTDLFYARKVAPIRAELPGLEHVLCLRTVPDAPLPPGTLDLAALMAAAAESFATVKTGPEDPALLHFTSGTTGKPKGVVHVHAAIAAHRATARFVLDLHDDDIFWCTADPGWVTGVSYGIIAPLACGVTMIVDREEFDPKRWYSILAGERVSVWYTAPTAIRMLMKAGLEPARAQAYPALRLLASVGEPLNPEAVTWGVAAFGRPFHDNWWQTETGGIMVANFLAMDVRPGSMGKPIPGIDAAIVERVGEGGVRVIEAAEEVGELALRPGWPSMFRGYLHEEQRYRACFVDGWYLTGDLVRRDADGYYWFVGRADDVIKSAGHLISPFEVESALMTHPAVSQAAVIGLPDEVMGQKVKAFVEIRTGRVADAALEKALLAHARRLLGPAVAPRELSIVEQLPRTRSGKILRRLLRARALGLPEGDLSTLEGGA